ncbi:uncharacterized protein LOC130048619 [Ostrea edulis]|uniref:uncharacterized protein LOC130048619 n=1 Tax=Ostrea edulis TaxID=37623 RepID=UPI0024AF131F|nr:uncharacterized protein LOC130048619 [Ostrea edulis]
MLTDDHSNNPKRFYRFIKSRRTESSDVAPLRKDDILHCDIGKLADALNSGEQMDCILLDFPKAFDKVPHQCLLNKCQYYGIRGNTLNWITSFLQGRTQQVLLDGKKSETSKVTTGVP